MKHRYYIAVPIIFGFISGLFLYGIGDDKEVLLSRENLIKNGSPMIGDTSAPITILEWGDYQCTYCYRFHESSLNTILDEYINSGKVNLVFKDFPLNGPDSVLAAEAESGPFNGKSLKTRLTFPELMYSSKIVFKLDS